MGRAAGSPWGPRRLSLTKFHPLCGEDWPCAARAFAAHVAKVMAREFSGIAPVEEVKGFKALVKHTQLEMMEPLGRWKVPPLFALPT